MMKDHCVIGIDVLNRTWGDEAEAIAHAKQLIADGAQSHGRNGGARRLAVVKVVKIVELDPPPMTVREPREGDLPS